MSWFAGVSLGFPIIRCVSDVLDLPEANVSIIAWAEAASSVASQRSWEKYLCCRSASCGKQARDRWEAAKACHVVLSQAKQKRGVVFLSLHLTNASTQHLSVWPCPVKSSSTYWGSTWNSSQTAANTAVSTADSGSNNLLPAVRPHINAPVIRSGIESFSDPLTRFFFPGLSHASPTTKLFGPSLAHNRPASMKLCENAQQCETFWKLQLQVSCCEFQQVAS